MRVITWQAPNGATIDISPSQEAELKKSGRWPRNASGEFCQVAKGLHGGRPSYRSVAEMFATDWVQKWGFDFYYGSGSSRTDIRSGCVGALTRDESESMVRAACPAPAQFVAVRRLVMRGAERIAEAVSHTMAKRIARALNNHIPNSKGY